MCLKALKADDEEMYMKLIDTTKDTRITHLLRQTDNYLQSLSRAVQAQQSNGRENYDFDQEESPACEVTFGALTSLDDGEKDKVDYYSVAHRIQEKITKPYRWHSEGRAPSVKMVAYKGNPTQ